MSSNKRVKYLPRPDHEEEEEEQMDAVELDDNVINSSLRSIASHPYNVEPLGNLYLYSTVHQHNVQRINGFGELYQLHNDELLHTVLSYIHPLSLVQLSMTSKLLHVYINSLDDLYKDYVVSHCSAESGCTAWTYQQNWKHTYAQYHCQKHNKPAAAVHPLSLDLPTVYSDYLYHIHQCSTINLPYLTTIKSNCDVVSCNDLSVQQFQQRYEQPNIPLIITDLVTQYPAYSGSGGSSQQWTIDNWLTQYGEIRVKTGSITMRMRDYIQYMLHTSDETPLYLFDNQFHIKMPLMNTQYSVPQYFDTDYFDLFNWTLRPSYRWILMGPPRSGSTFHKDPNCTSAWNSLIRGTKHWLLYPPHLIPPACIPDAQHNNIITPISVSEWFINHYAEHCRIRSQYDQRRQRAGFNTLCDVYQHAHTTGTPVNMDLVGPVEVTCHAGQCIYIPHNWWHIAINIEDSIAVTQNYCNDSNLIDIINFWSTDVHENNRILRDELVKQMSIHYPNKIQQLQEQRDGQIKLRDEQSKKKAVKKMSLWDRMK